MMAADGRKDDLGRFRNLMRKLRVERNELDAPDVVALPLLRHVAPEQLEEHLGPERCLALLERGRQELLRARAQFATLASWGAQRFDEPKFAQQRDELLSRTRDIERGPTV